MTQIIAAVQEKGGVGKSMILCALAAHLAEDGLSVAIVDTDPQATCAHWVAAGDVAVDIVPCLDENRVADILDAVTERHRVVLIDTAGYKSAMAIYAVQWADAVLVPMAPAMPDVRGAVAVWRHVDNAAKAARRTATVRVVLNQVNERAAITKKVRAAIDKVGMPALDTRLPQLTGFREMLSHGGPPRGKARTAFANLVAELRSDGLLDRRHTTPADKEETANV